MSEGTATSHDAGRRDYLRLELKGLAWVETLDGRKKVEILDLSQGGARVVLLDPADPFRDCVLCWLGFESFASVGRRSGNELGLIFDAPLRPGVIKKTRELAPQIWRDDSAHLNAIARDFVQGTYDS